MSPMLTLLPMLKLLPTSLVDKKCIKMFHRVALENDPAITDVAHIIAEYIAEFKPTLAIITTWQIIATPDNVSYI